MNTQCYMNGYYAGAQGANLYFQGWLPAEIRALIILLHGSGEHSGFYSHIGEECLRRHVGLIAPDLRGSANPTEPAAMSIAFRSTWMIWKHSLGGYKNNTRMHRSSCSVTA
jgi:alpha-beta hydrolase superfamily lysophospholipase